ncbi:MAG: AAA family ATPase [Pseudohongiella sp.]|nr:AAA family ATPase [Pseudohongiella sp.]
MHLHLLTFKNVRQFDERTFKFETGFNLLVGENGAGKTTILRGILAALASARKIGNRPRLGDDDVRLRTSTAEIEAIVHRSNGRAQEFQIKKTLWEPERRSTHRRKLPLVLLYSSNEALCPAMKTKAAKRGRKFDNDSSRRNEAFLYESEKYLPQTTQAKNDRRFGNSQPVREFVKSVLANFSPGMGDFYWRFEPYNCSLVLTESTEEKPMLDAAMQQQAQSFAMRWFEERREERKRRGFIWPDQAKVTLSANSSEYSDGESYLPTLSDIWRDMEITPSVRERLLSCSLEVKLTPRIMIEREIGRVSLNQLSDGEQRLFSLFVDIARQLSINNPYEIFGEGEAIILIDEIDVHLHPKWQRLIVPSLEELFPKCQFIATTHSPFVIQATRRNKITSIDKNLSALLDVGNSIEDIVEEIQGISVPQRSLRAERLNAAAKEYFTLLERQSSNDQQVNPKELQAAELSYREASEPFTSYAALHALLKIIAIGGKDQ